MSKNKIIAFVHGYTGLPYSVCRARLKACKWDIWAACGIPDVQKILETLPDVMNRLKEAIANLAENTGKALITMAESLREVQNESISMR